jgi:rhodanese-related sulfurtransferase
MSKRFGSLALIVPALVLAAVARGGQGIQALGPKEAFDLLKNPAAVLVDVRSVAEYVLVGHAPRAHNVPFSFWNEAKADFEENAGFAEDLKTRFKPAVTLIFICRSGRRSVRAAEAARGAGFSNVFSVSEGFEGEKDESGRRTVGGWKNSGLPWTVDVDPALAYRWNRNP